VCEPLRSHRTSISAIKVVTTMSSPILLTGSAGNTIRVWDIKEGEPRCIEKLRGHTKGVFSLQSTPSVLMSGSLDNVIKVWDPRQGYRLIYDLRMRDEQGNDIVAFAEDQHTEIGVITFQCDDTKVVSGGPDKIVRIWDLRMRAIVNEFEGHSHWITTLQFDENKIVTGSRDKTVRFWDMSGKMLDEISPTFNEPADDTVQLPPANLGAPAAPPLPPPAPLA
jgi:WD40 repeat protein